MNEKSNWTSLHISSKSFEYFVFCYFYLTTFVHVERTQFQIYCYALLFSPFKIVKFVLFALRDHSPMSPTWAYTYRVLSTRNAGMTEKDGSIAWISATFWTCTNAVVIHISLDELRGSSVSAKFVVLIDRRNRVRQLLSMRPTNCTVYIIICSLLYYMLLLRSIVIVHYDDTLIIVTIINCYIVRLLL